MSGRQRVQLLAHEDMHRIRYRLQSQTIETLGLDLGFYTFNIGWRDISSFMISALPLMKLRSNCIR